MSQWLKGQRQNVLWRTSLSGFWQVPWQGPFDPSIPNLSLEVAAATPTIQFVGAVTGTAASGTITLNLTSLSGGIGGSLLENDIVIFVHSLLANGNLNPGTSTTGYTEIADLYSNDTNETNLSVSWKRMGSTPDTSVVSNTHSGEHSAIAYVLRGVDTSTALDVTATTATGANTAVFDPPAITPATAGALVVAIGGGPSNTGNVAPFTPPAGYGNAVSVSSSTNSPNVGAAVASKYWSSGTEDPGAWSGPTTSGSFSWAAVTLALRPQSAGNAYSIAADAGSYSVTGTAAGLKHARITAAAPGSYSITGQVAGLKHAWKTSAAPGSYALSGVAAGLVKSWKTSAAPGSYSLTGQPAGVLHGWKAAAAAGSYSLSGFDATLTKSGGPKVVTADAGSYSLTGTAAALKLARITAAAPGSYAITGQTAGVRHGWRTSALSGSYTLTGTAAGVLHGWKTTAAPGTYNVTGVAAGLKVSRKIAAAPGSYSLTGFDASLTKSGSAKTVIADAGNYTLTGTIASIRHSWTLSAGPGSYAITGTPAGLKQARRVAAAPGSYSLTGQPAAFRKAWKVGAAAGAYSLTGATAGLKLGRKLAAAPGSYALTGFDASLVYTPAGARPPYSQGFILS